MRVFSEYIFLRHPEEDSSALKKSSKSGYVISIQTLFMYLKKTFPRIEELVEDDTFFAEKYRLVIEENAKEFEAYFQISEVARQSYLVIEVQGSSLATAVSLLASIQNKLLKSGIREHWIDIVSHDGVSEYYGDRLYPKLNHLERRLRTLLLNVYALNYGVDYLAHFDEEIVNDAKKNIRQGKNTPMSRRDMGNAYKRNGVSIKDISYCQFFFESIDLGTLQNILFKERQRTEEREAVDSFLHNTEDLSMVDDAKLREMFELMRPKSDWEIFFQPKLSNIEFDIETMLDRIREIRNQVAHCRVLTKENYEEGLDLCGQLTKAIDKAICETKEKDFAARNFEELKRIIEPIQKLMENFLVYTDGLVETMSKALENVSLSLSTLVQKSAETVSRGLPAFYAEEEFGSLSN